MRRLNQVPNIGGTSPAYPDGVIIDNATGVTGTALTEILYGDLIQAVHKIKRLSGITENGNPDNETNGFQLLQAMFQNMVPAWQPASANVNFSLTKWVTYNNGFYYHRTVNNTNNNPSVDTTNWFRVFYWNGSTIVFSDESRIAGIETGITNLNSGLTALQQGLTQLTDRVTALETKSSWLPMTPGTALNSTPYLQIRRANSVVVMMGQFALGPTGDDLFTIPSSIPAPIVDLAFTGVDGFGQTMQFKVYANTRNAILSRVSGRNTLYYFNCSYII